MILLVAFIPLRGGIEAEDELKCATLLAFVHNARWTEQPANTPLTVGVIGRDAFFRSLRTSIEGKSVDGHPLRVLEVNAPVDPRCCQVLYFATDKLTEIRPILPALGSAHVLTVGESDAFLEQGGVAGSKRRRIGENA